MFFAFYFSKETQIVNTTLSNRLNVMIDSKSEQNVHDYSGWINNKQSFFYDNALKDCYLVIYLTLECGRIPPILRRSSWRYGKMIY